MSKKEREQHIVFEKLKNKELTQKEAGARLLMSRQWVSKKLKRYVEKGAEGLVHRNRGKVSEKQWNKEEKAVMLRLIKNEWSGFGPTFVAEKLWELKQIKVSKETVRNAMIAAGVWEGQKRKSRHRSRRERKELLGMMVQLDGSPHDWFEGRAPKCTLLVFIDDATSEILWLEFTKGESTLGVLRATYNYVSKHGIPQSFYVDFGSVFSVNVHNAMQDKKTQWERVINDLGTVVHHARSPQAKGRVERANKTLQDRLVKELRLAGISSIEAANQFLRQSNFISNHNENFTVPACSKGDAHRSPALYDLQKLFRIQETRVLANDFTVTLKKTTFQLHAIQPIPLRPKDRITVNLHLDRSFSLSIRDFQLEFSIIPSRPTQQKQSPILITPRKPHRNSTLWASGSFIPPLQREEVG